MRRADIVFVFADYKGYGDFSAFNGGLSNTPVLDALMAVLDKAFCGEL